MKRIIFAALAASTISVPAYANTVCEDISMTAAAIMTARMDNIPVEKILNVIATTETGVNEATKEALRGIVTKAYELPMVEDPKERAKYIAGVTIYTYQKCMEKTGN